MSEEVGRELGNSIGRFIEMDRQARQSEQAKFIRIRVDLLLDKPLRREGRVASVEGEKCWVSFRYERLPIFCFQCGKLGHNEKHCLDPPDQQTPGNMVIGFGLKVIQGWEWKDLNQPVMEIKSYSQNHVDAVINDMDHSFKWRLTGFYGHPETH